MGGKCGNVSTLEEFCAEKSVILTIKVETQWKMDTVLFWIIAIDPNIQVLEVKLEIFLANL